MTREHDIAVIGGGLVGSAIAYGLARLGRRVALLDEGDVAYRASRGNFAPGLGAGQRAGSARLRRLDARLGPALSGICRAALRGRRRRRRAGAAGRLPPVPVRGRTRAPRRTAHAAAWHSPGSSATPTRCSITARWRGGCRASARRWWARAIAALDGHLNSLRLLRALHAGFLARGGSYLPNAKVEAVAREGGAFAVRMAAGRIGAGKVVLAAGLGNATLAPHGRPHGRGAPAARQVVVTERMRRFLDYPLATLRQTDEGTRADRRLAGGGRLRRHAGHRRARHARRAGPCRSSRFLRERA